MKTTLSLRGIYRDKMRARDRRLPYPAPTIDSIAGPIEKLGVVARCL